MILTVTPNPALDVTYELPGPLTPGAEHRASAVVARAGGKGLNVTRVLRTLGESVVATGFSGGSGGADLRARLDQAGITHDFLDALPDVRRTLVVRDSDRIATSLWEPGYPPRDAATASASLVTHVRAHLDSTDVLTVSGSLPPRISQDLPAHLAQEAAAAGVPCIVDTSGDALAAAIESGGAVTMPNRDEVAAVSGKRPDGSADAALMARAILHEHQPPAIIVTLGSAGMVAVTNNGAWSARLGEDVKGNPTGAGDAACAAVARGLRGGYDKVDWPATLGDAVALSAAAVLCPVAGEVDLDAYRRWLPTITVESL